MSLRDIRRHVGQLAIVGFNGHAVPDEVRDRWPASSISAASSSSPATSTTPEQVADLSRESQELAAEIPLWVSVDQEGRTGRAAEAAVHRVAADGDARARRRARRREARGTVREGAGRRAPCRRHFARLHARPRRPDEPEEPGDRRSRRWPSAPTTSRGSARRSSAPCRGPGSPPAASIFPATAIPASTRTSRCRCSITRPIVSMRWSSCRSRRRSPPASRRS